MRWPNRHPHVLTPGMREAQRALAEFLPCLDWTRFRRRNLTGAMACDDAGVQAIGSGDAAQALAWLVRTDNMSKAGTIAPRDDAAPATLTIPGLADGRYDVTAYDTRAGAVRTRTTATSHGGVLRATLGPVRSDLAVAVRA